jgi:sulfur-carrier protein adenylyltransferase/sulfurtransferase
VEVAGMADFPQALLEDRLRCALEAVKADLGADPAFELISTKDAPPFLAACPAVWRKTFRVSDKEWIVNVGLPRHFPDEVPIACISDSKDLVFKNPHIDERGFICTIPNSAATNSKDAAGLVCYVFDDAEKILRGTGSLDFQNEFTSYWNRTATLQDQPIFLIDPAEQIDNRFSVAFCKGCICVASSMERINRWISNRMGQPSDLKEVGLALTVHLDAPLLPNAYPETLADLISVAEGNDPSAANLIKEHVTNGSRDGLALLIQKEGDGIALGGVVFPVVGLSALNSSQLTHGFRPGKIPVDLLRKRAIGMIASSKVKRGVVRRVDHRWIHSRGGDGRDLSNKSILLIGCGSLGGYVAHLLSRAGVGHLTMTDNDFLSWDNLGRHILGASSIGHSKAEALADQLTRELPHLSFKGIARDWRDAFASNPNLFAEHDLVVSTTGDWRCERPLNEMTRKVQMPPVILSWLEPHAVAGHCLVIAQAGGCFECAANEFGRFLQAVADFEKTPLSREPGGCAHYQQYGPTALMPVASMIASVTIESLLNTPSESFLNTWVSIEEHFKSVKANLTEIWAPEVSRAGYSRIFRKNWNKSADCVVCAQVKS